MRRRGVRALLLWVWLCGLVVGGVWAEGWQEGSGYRYRELRLPEEGRTGFTRLTPGQTGIAFTNSLSDHLAARNRILENGSGVALGDVDGDGWVDIYFCALEGGNRLYRNLGGWKFEDITGQAGVGCEGQFSTGAVFADVNGNGHLDLLVNSVGGGTRLFMNDGSGRFTEKLDSGLMRRFGSMSMALADLDGNGTLDLYVTNYRTTTVKDAPPGMKMEIFRRNGEIIIKPENRFIPLMHSEGIIAVEKGEPDFVHVNKGEGRFGRISWTGGAFVDEDRQPLEQTPMDWGLAVMFRDVNADGTPDLYVCNDFFYSRDYFWINERSVRFRAIPRLAVRNMSLSSMAVDFADLNRNGHEDFLVVDMLSRMHTSRHRQLANVLQYQVEMPLADPEYRPEVARNTLQFNRGDGTYAEIAQLMGIAASEWSWSVIFLDVDLDGFEDVLITTGHNHDVLDADALAEISRSPASDDGTHFENLLRFPRLITPNLLFRNERGESFREIGQEWGFNTAGISHGMALADLDNDGDLDVVVNNLNDQAGLYRNESGAPRVAVRLRGLAPNTQGIGAKIRLHGGAVPVQSQEVISGGRYLSGDDPMRVFAAGSLTNRMRLEVAWRSGRRSVVEGVQANHLYEIAETSGDPIAPIRPISPIARPLFEDVSHLLEGHRHVDEPFDDFAVQPLLSRKFSQLGPGVSWYDVDGDGFEDLIIGGGKGGQLAVYRNLGEGFERMKQAPLGQPVTRDQTTVLGWRDEQGRVALLAGSANYEDGLELGSVVREYDLGSGRIENRLPGRLWSVGPLALGDMTGDGQLELFVGGRVRAGRYPESVSSEIYRREGGRWVREEGSSAVLEGVGLVSGALWTDLDGDGWPELVLACEWGPVRVYANERGRLREATIEWGLSGYVGWWQGVASGDFTGDGRMDLVAGNWGRNSKYESYRGAGLRLYYGDLSGDGRIEGVEGYWAEELGKWVPWKNLQVMGRVLPFVRERYGTFRAYGEAGIEEILGGRLKEMEVLEAGWLESTVFLNRGGKFKGRALPVKAQFAPVFGIGVGDLDGDGVEDIVLSQNFFGVEAESSRYDAGRGLWLKGDGEGGFDAVSGQTSGITVWGEGRGLALGDFDGDGRLDLAVGQNGGETKLYRNVGGRAGLRVRLDGPAGNPLGIGAMVRVGDESGWGPAREVQGGSGYWSQPGAVLVLSLGAEREVERVWVRWPGGRESEEKVAAGTREVVVRY